jgi:hypothetical protein
VASAPGSPAAVPSAASAPLVPASSSARATPRPSRTMVPATAAGDYRPPPSPARASAARHAATTPLPGGTPTPRLPNRLDRRWLRGHPDFRERPGWWRWRRPPAPGSWGQSPRHRRR